MAQPINPNPPALSTQEPSKTLATQSTPRISSGERVDNSADDAASVAVSERMNSEVRGMNASMRSAYEGVYVSKTIDGSLQQVSEKLQQLKQLSEQSTTSQSDTSSSELSSYEDSMSALAQIDGMLDNISVAQAQVSTTQTMFEGTISNLQDTMANQSASSARIIDADYAVEAAKKVSALIQRQGGDAMAVQANIFPKSVLQLIV